MSAKELEEYINKIEPNMYVRLNCNYELGIGKTIGEIDEDNFIKTKFKDDFECSLPIYMIKKASHNIVDLLEVGDYVNGLRVEKSKYGELYTSYTYMGGDIGLQQETYTTFLKDYEEDDVYSILTREQFESMSYKVSE